MCGGDGSGCETVTGVMRDQDLKMGYNDMSMIPLGATNILITEMKASNNYLALRNSSGHYFLNGNWRIDYPQKMDICGTTFHYERKYKNSKAKGPLTLFAPENIRALGPTTCSLYVVVSISADHFKLFNLIYFCYNLLFRCYPKKRIPALSLSIP